MLSWADTTAPYKKMKQLQQRHQKIDQALQLRQDSLIGYAQSMRDISNMGVKIVMPDGSIEVEESFSPYLEQYDRSGLEFEWTAEYDGKPPTLQFGPGPTEEHHFGDIDQNVLSKIHWISNFNWPTDNVEKRVIVTLDWKTGIIEFLNGFAPQEVKAEVSMDPITGPKKLILFMKRRRTSSVGDIPEDIKNFHPETNISFVYNEFLLGFETESGVKRCIVIQPNGTISLFHN